ncbi:hypothetical protein PTQ19_10370 [Microbacterium esteraromaticum]|uniref:hypothetical protein n=1 Tax=Microbacterium esteraromaticum TaxID=57043 RepID=UPI002368EE61|nr:hypothetical protein [Microbacterium esteraromaticum]WDH77926.1 hypothetical protein PTQ19_10370 [Microbacterium esteraromaticum]
MAPAYQNINSGQIVVSDEPRPDLEAQARWEEVPVPDATVPPAGTPLTEAELAEAAAREAVGDTGSTPADVIETIPGTENNPPIEIIGEPVEDGEHVAPGEIINADGSAAPTGEDGIPVLPPAAETPEEVPVPDETWTDEALDALGKERGITWRSNASKATKVAKLTAPAGE